MMIEKVMIQLGWGGARQPPPHNDRKSDDSIVGAFGGAAAPPMMMEKTMIQLGAKTLKSSGGGWQPLPMMIEKVMIQLAPKNLKSSDGAAHPNPPAIESSLFRSSWGGCRPPNPRYDVRRSDDSNRGGFKKGCFRIHKAGEDWRGWLPLYIDYIKCRILQALSREIGCTKK